MALLRIRDKDGNITEVPALKGDKGEQGEKGHSGIYTGDGQPPEGYDVWVDKSENYQEGAYVSFETQNLTNIQKEIARDNIDAAKKTGDWEKLYEITTDGATKKWEISTFADGDALALTSLGVKIVAKNPVSEAPVSAHLTLRGKYVENGSDLLTVMVPLLNIISTTENLVAVSTINNDRGIWFTKFCEAVPNLAGKLSPESYIPSNMFTYDGVQYPIINTVTLSGNGTLAAGNTIEIWGVRK